MSIERRSFTWLLLGLMALALYLLHPFFYTLLMAGILAIVFYPLHLKILKLTKQRENIAAFASVLSVIVLLIIPIAILLVLLTTQLAGLLQVLPQGSPEQLSAELGSNQGSVWWHYWQRFGEPLIHKIEAWTGTKIDVVALFWQGLQRAAKWLAQYSPAVIAKTANFFFELFFMLLVLFYLFRDGQILMDKIVKISPIEDRYERSLADGIQETLYGIFYGSFLTGAIQAVLATIAFWIARVPGALVWGVITFFASFVPIVGTAAVLLPVVCYLLIIGEWGYAVFVAIYGVVVIGSADNFLRPMLVRSSTHTALIFLGLFGGMAVFGAIGILMGPMIMGLLTGTLRIYEENYLSEGQESEA